MCRKRNRSRDAVCSASASSSLTVSACHVRQNNRTLLLGLGWRVLGVLCQEWSNSVGCSVVLQRLLSLLICTPLFSREVWAGARKSRWADGYNAVGGSHGSCARLMLARRPAVSFAHKEKLSYEQRCYESTRVREHLSSFPLFWTAHTGLSVLDVFL